MLKQKTHFTPGPWGCCKNGDCSCSQVWCEDHPIAKVIRGTWGDEYPSIRLEGGSLERKAEAYMEKIEYGSVSEDASKANARLIAASPQMFAALVAAEDALTRANAETDLACVDVLTTVRTAIDIALAGRAESYALQEVHKKMQRGSLTTGK